VKVLVIGGGGREHAIAWKLAQSPRVSEVIVAPGNAGTATERKTRNVAVGVADHDKLIELARAEQVALTIVGPEIPLVAGIVDRFEAAGLQCFGPKAAGAQLEGSKAFTKEFLVRHGIPTAAYRAFTDFAAAREYARTQRPPIVIKADGLAAGKGVIIASTLAEAEQTLERVLQQRQFGDAGAKVVIEDFLTGEEASFIALVDGTRVVPLASSQDHKTRDDGDRGPNTGGMGAYSPAPILDAPMAERVMAEIVRPTVAAMASEGVPFAGFLYVGLMIGRDGPRVIEFNCRLGDPETQPILFRLRSDLLDVLSSCFDGTLGERSLDWDSRATVGVVMASRGYPDAYDKGKPIAGLDAATGADVKVFHAGTRLQGGKVVTDGGRVLCVVGAGTTVRAACDAAYAGVGKVTWDGAFYRSDIGHRAIQREEGGTS